MEGKRLQARQPGLEPFCIDGAHAASTMIDLGAGHWVRAAENASEELARRYPRDRLEQPPVEKAEV